MWYVDNPFCERVSSPAVLEALSFADVYYAYGEFLFEPAERRSFAAG